MPVVLCTTVSESGLTNIGSYSLCFPFGISKDRYMMLISRGTSNTEAAEKEGIDLVTPAFLDKVNEKRR